MADKTATSIRGTAISAGGVTTAGSIAADRVQIIFDDTLSSGECLSLIEKAAAMVSAYYLKR